MEWKNIRAIHCFGDSLTAGYGAFPGKGWVAQLDLRLRGISVYSHGVCGALVSDIVDEMSGFTSFADAGDAVFFMGGTNDILCGYQLEFLEKKVEVLVREVAEKMPLTLGIPPLATRESIFTGWQSEENFDLNQKNLLDYGDFLRELARRENILCLDFAKAFPEEDAWYADGLHPNGKGYERMADLAVSLWQ